MVRPVCFAPALLLLGTLLILPSRVEAQAVVVDEPTTVVAASEDAQRQAILAALDRAEVRRVADTAGLDLDAARGRVQLLEGEPLARAAGQAREVERRLAIDGYISSTTLIILLVLTILLIVLLQS
ncbi:MAG TPA: hypothetical protein VFG78_11920 [Gemmatimonadota bacterium]|nr:hypothetical protein [Gemmatimonadota bacterium]